MKGTSIDGINPANQLIGSLSHCLQGLYIPDGAGFLPSTVVSESPFHDPQCTELS